MRNESIIQNLSSALMTAFLGCVQEKMECAIQVCLPHIVSHVKRAMAEEMEMNEVEADEDEEEEEVDEDEEEEDEEIETIKSPPPKQRVSRKVVASPQSHKLQRSPSNPLSPSMKKQSKTKNTSPRGKKKRSQSKSSKSISDETSSMKSSSPPPPPPPPAPSSSLPNPVPSSSHHLSPSPPSQNVYHLSGGKPPSAFPIEGMQSHEFTSQFPQASQQYF